MHKKEMKNKVTAVESGENFMNMYAQIQEDSWELAAEGCVQKVLFWEENEKADRRR